MSTRLSKIEKNVYISNRSFFVKHAKDIPWNLIARSVRMERPKGSKETLSYANVNLAKGLCDITMMSHRINF